MEQLFIAGNPLESLPKLPKRITVDVTLPELSDTEMRERSKAKSNALFPDKKCSWCNKSSGYRKEIQRTDSKWGFSTHVSIVMVCRNCSYMHQFYSRRSLFDFD